MGFFSNKKEKDKTEDILNQVMASLFKNCPKCGTEKFQIMDKFFGSYKSETFSSASYQYDMTSFTGGTTGICPSCGFIAHGHVFYKGATTEDSFQACYTSLNLLNMWFEIVQKILSRNDLTNEAKSNILNSELIKFRNDVKTTIPDYSAKVDFEYFIKLCFEFKYKTSFS